jgi:hypothetical protein
LFVTDAEFRVAAPDVERVERDVLPVTPRVPEIDVLPVVSTTNLFVGEAPDCNCNKFAVGEALVFLIRTTESAGLNAVATSKSFVVNPLENVPSPVTPNDPVIVALFVTPKEFRVAAPDDVSVVNAPLEATVFPIAVALIEPPVIAALPEFKFVMFAVVEERLGMVTVPVPNVTGLFVVVLMDKVVAVVRSITGEKEAILVVTLLNVTVPVPVENELEPVTVVGPFKLTAPDPVPNVPAPF